MYLTIPKGFLIGEILLITVGIVITILQVVVLYKFKQDDDCVTSKSKYWQLRLLKTIIPSVFASASLPTTFLNSYFIIYYSTTIIPGVINAFGCHQC
uniref:Aa_trans domain-containing protein n=1 Tax=Panagrellus redivivus TaxID=6233 RepID=A0A7E4VK96_PANRE